MTVLTR